MISTIIVDDEPLARQGLRMLLEEWTDLAIVAECSNGREAVGVLRERPVDLLFLDVAMPDLEGFEVLQQLPNADPPLVVFITAHAEHAVRAFEANAVDYLVKPFDRERLQMTLRRVVRTLRLRQAEATLRDGAPGVKHREWVDRLVVKDRGRVWFVRAADIEWIEARGNYVRLRTPGGAPLLRETLSGVEQMLDPRRFFRISRSCLVNLDRVREFRSRPSGRYEVLMDSGTLLESSRRYASRLDALFRLA